MSYRYELGDEVFVTGEIVGISDGFLSPITYNIKTKDGKVLSFVEKHIDGIVFYGDKPSRLPFTKSDLKDGMRCTDKDGLDFYVCGQVMYGVTSKSPFPINEWNDDLTDRHFRRSDIMRVTDRDGTVVFEREQQPQEVTSRLTKEEINAIAQDVLKEIK